MNARTRSLALGLALFAGPALSPARAAGPGEADQAAPSASPSPAPEASPAPSPAPNEQAQGPVAGQPVAPTGQWVHTQQYGWIWMPYGDAYTYVPPEGPGEPQVYVYYPVAGWTWLAAPWVWGHGPWPWFGVHGAWGYGWYRHAWWRSPGWGWGWGWHGHPGWGWRGHPGWGWRGSSGPYRASPAPPHGRLVPQGGFVPRGGSAAPRGGLVGGAAPPRGQAGGGWGGGRR